MTGRDFKYIRFKHYMTQEYAATIVGISRFALSGYEAERVRIPITTALRLHRLYNMSGEDIENYISRM